MKFFVLRPRRILALVALAAIAPLASAIPIATNLSFSALGISGSFGVDLDSSTQVILGLNSVDLTINGFAFDTSNVGAFYNAVSNTNAIGGLLNGVEQVVGGSATDFLLFWAPSEKIGFFAYTYVAAGQNIFNGLAPLSVAPAAVVSDSSLGFWTAIPMVCLFVFRRLLRVSKPRS